MALLKEVVRLGSPFGFSIHLVVHHFAFSHHKHSVLNCLHVNIIEELLVIEQCCCSGQPARLGKQEESMMEAKLS